jgi:hypothetical protein
MSDPPKAVGDPVAASEQSDPIPLIIGIPGDGSSTGYRPSPAGRPIAPTPFDRAVDSDPVRFAPAPRPSEILVLAGGPPDPRVIRPDDANRPATRIALRLQEPDARPIGAVHQLLGLALLPLGDSVLRPVTLSCSVWPSVAGSCLRRVNPCATHFGLGADEVPSP